jgi:hypothetical protein
MSWTVPLASPPWKNLNIPLCPAPKKRLNEGEGGTCVVRDDRRGHTPSEEAIRLGRPNVLTVSTKEGTRWG